MVEGIYQFSRYFKDFNNRYILIGDAACFLALDEVGLEFRETRNIDIVLCLEALDAEFAWVFWDFIKLGRYKNTQKIAGKELFCRFYYTEDEEVPYAVILFSPFPDVLMMSDGTHLSSIPMGEEQSSFSAILLEEGYYNFIHNSKIYIGDIPTIPPEVIVPLKAKALLDLIRRQDTDY